MKILFLTGSLNQGGAEFQTLALADLFQRKGHEVQVLALTDYSFLLHYIESQNLNYKHFSNNDSRFLRILKTIKEVNKYNPDWMISYTRIVSKTALIAKLLSYRKFKLLISERTSLILPKKDPFYFFIVRYANILTTNSMSKIEYIKSKFPKLKSKTHFFQNIINLKEYQNLSKQPSPNNIKRFCYVGRISPEKNVKNLILAFCRIWETEKNWKLNIYGEARNQNYLEEIIKIIKENNLKENIQLKGVSNNVKEVYHSHDFLCLLSFYEGFSNVLSEALASGTPVIASNIPENSFLIQDKENGFLVQPDDINDIERAIQEAINLTNKEAAAISSANINKARVIFDEDALYQRYMELFNK